MLTNLEGDRRFGYCRRLLVRQCGIFYILTPFTQHFAIFSSSLLERVLDCRRSTVSLVHGDVLICMKRSVGFFRVLVKVMFVSVQVLDRVEERRETSRAAVFTFLKAINENPFPRPVSRF